MRKILLVSCIILIGSPAYGEVVEATQPNVIVSPSDFFPGDPTGIQRGTFYHPMILNVGGEMLLFVQGGVYRAGECRGDTVHLFRAPWTYDGLRDAPSHHGRVTPCDCFDPGCPLENLTHYGIGSVLRSNHDQQFYMLVDIAAPNALFDQGDFLEIRLGSSADAISWTFPESDSTLIAKSLVCTPQCETISAFGAEVVPESSYWWGIFSWDVVESGLLPNKLGRLKIVPNSSDPRGFDVLILSGGTYQATASDGTFSFLPDSVGPIAISSELIERDGSFQLWQSSLAFQADVEGGCANDDTPLGSKIVYRDITENTISGFVDFDSVIQPMPSANSTGYVGPIVIEDAGGNELLFQSSSDTICEQFPSFWPPGGNTFVGMEVTVSALAERNEKIRDSFSQRIVGRNVGDPINGTSVEIGTSQWAADPVFVMASTDAVTVDTDLASDKSSLIPITPTQDVLEVSADLGLSGSEWLAVGLSSATNIGLFGGEIWLLLNNLTDKARLFVNGSPVTEDPIPSQVSNVDHVRLIYDSTENSVTAVVNDSMIIGALDLDSIPGGAFIPNINAAGFHANKPDAEVSYIDNFRIFEWSSLVFQDDFESGDIAEWSSSVP